MNIFNPIAGVAVAVYVGLVWYRGNIDRLAYSLSREGKFLEFLIAVYLLYALATSKRIGGYVMPLVTVGLIAVALRLSLSDEFSHAIEKFRKGEIGLFETFGMIFNLSNSSRVLHIPELGVPLLRPDPGPTRE